MHRAAVAQAETIIETRVQNFMQWLDTRSVVPVIRHMHTQADALRRAEVDKAQKLLARGDDPAAVLEALSQALTNKLIHGPTSALNRVNGADRDSLIDLMRGFYQHARARTTSPATSAANRPAAGRAPAYPFRIPLPGSAAPHHEDEHQRKLDQLSTRLAELNDLLSRENVTADLDQYRKLTREHAELGPVVEQYALWRQSRSDETAAQELLGDLSMRDFAEDEIRSARERMTRLETELQKMLLPKDPNDDRNIFSKSVRARAATNRRCSRATCCACTCASRNASAGRSK